MVDAINFQNSPEMEITTKQIVVADLILVSKSENLSNIQQETLKTTLQKINPFSEIDFFRLNQWNNIQFKSILQKNKTEFDFAGFSVSHASLSTQTLQFNKPLNKEDFTRWLSYTLDIYKNEIYRVKGILCFENEPYEYILQGVGGSFEITEGELIMGEVKSKIAFIGKNMPELK